MSDDEAGIEFLETDAAPGSDGDFLDTAPRRRRSTILIAVIFLVAAALGVGAAVGSRHASTAGQPTVSSRSTASASPPILLPTATPTASVRQWEGVAGTTARSVCASCAVADAPTSVSRAARRALQTVSRLRALVLDGHEALVVSALLIDGIQLVAVLTPPSVVPDPTTFGIPPPLGVQSQRNGKDRLVVVIGGNADAVSLLGQPAVQSWLAALHR